MAAAVTSRRSSCSLEVMQGLRAKCHARYQSTQQNSVIMTSESEMSAQPAAATPTVSTSSDSTSELPPDILQSCLYLLLLTNYYCYCYYYYYY